MVYTKIIKRCKVNPYFAELTSCPVKARHGQTAGLSVAYNLTAEGTELFASTIHSFEAA